MKKFFLLLLLLFVGGYWWWQGKQPLASPQGKKVWGLSTKRHYEVVGFLPSWMVKKAKIEPEVLGQLIFLGVGVEANGALVWDGQAKLIYSPEFEVMRRRMHESGKKVILGVKLFEDKKIDKLMASETAQERLVGEIKEVVEQGQFDGVNVDFEYVSNPTGVLEEEFLVFLKSLREAEVGEISLDVFCNTILKGNWESLSEAAKILDWVVIMAYDFHRPGSMYAGAVAPIRAGAAERSILETLQTAWEIGLPREKLIVAYPLYGYEWRTYGEELGAQVKPGQVAMASYGRMKSELLEKGVEANWDSLALSPWIAWEEEGEWYQVYFENLASISVKVKLVVESQMGGVGFWALGYEGEEGKEVWEEVKRWVN